MLAKKNRLSKRKDFERIFKEGKKAKEDFLFFRFLETKNSICQFAFLISKKVSKKATIRNRLKRQMAEIVRLKLDLLKPGLKGIFIALPGIEKLKFREIEKTIQKLFQKTKCFKN